MLLHFAAQDFIRLILENPRKPKLKLMFFVSVTCLEGILPPKAAPDHPQELPRHLQDRSQQAGPTRPNPAQPRPNPAGFFKNH